MDAFISRGQQSGKTSDRRHITYLRSSSRRRQFLAPRNERARFGEILRDFRLSSSHYWGHLFVAAATMKLCRSRDKSMTGVTIGGGGGDSTRMWAEKEQEG